MQPIGKHIIIQQIEEEVTTKSGILLSGADTSQLRYKRAKVVASGTDVSAIKPGDEIYYDKNHGFTMMINDGQYTVIQEHHVVVVL
jgi:co-chaperonin GroES (HSP10)